MIFLALDPPPLLPDSFIFEFKVLGDEGSPIFLFFLNTKVMLLLISKTAHLPPNSRQIDFVVQNVEVGIGDSNKILTFISIF